MKLISTYWRESDMSVAKVYRDTQGVSTIQYYDNAGMLLDKESFPNKNLRFHEDAAENWAMGIKLTP